MKYNIIPAEYKNEECNKNNDINSKFFIQKCDKYTKKKVIKFKRIKRKCKKRSKKTLKNKKQESGSSIFSSKEDLFEICQSFNSTSLNEEDKFDSEKYKVDLLNSNNNNNNKIEENYQSEVNSQVITIFVGIPFNSKSLIQKK